MPAPRSKSREWKKFEVPDGKKPDWKGPWDTKAVWCGDDDKEPSSLWEVVYSEKKWAESQKSKHQVAEEAKAKSKAKPKAMPAKVFDKTKLEPDVRSEDSMSTAASTVTTAALLPELSKRLEEVNLAEDMNSYNKMNGKAKGQAQGQASEASTSDANRPMDVDDDASGPGKTGPELPPIPEAWDSDAEDEYVMVHDKRLVKVQLPGAEQKSSGFKQGRKVRCSTCQGPKNDASWRSVKNTKVQVGDQWFWDYCCADCLRKENPGMTWQEAVAKIKSDRPDNVKRQKRNQEFSEARAKVKEEFPFMNDRQEIRAITRKTFQEELFGGIAHLIALKVRHMERNKELWDEYMGLVQFKKGLQNGRRSRGNFEIAHRA